MSALPEQWDFLATGWRFAMLLTGCREGAGKVYKEAVDEVARHPDAPSPRRSKILFFTALRRRALKFPARLELAGAAADLHAVLEPGRSALALLLLDALSSDEIEFVLSLDEKRLADYVQKARAELQAKTGSVR